VRLIITMKEEPRHKKQKPAIDAAVPAQPKKKKPSKKKRLQLKKNAKPKGTPVIVPSADATANLASDVVSQAVSVPEKLRRDFSTDLLEYLSGWKNRESSPWKFNKTLQIWALEHCFDESKIDATLFKELLPYLASIQGGALDRLKTRAQEMIQSVEDGDDDGDDGQKEAGKATSLTRPATDAELKRAIKIQAKIGKP
jgi:WKF domain